jgi:riboflavin kinase/FMN adenylyltransferase
VEWEVMDGRCIEGIGNVPEAIGPCVLTVGNFDGLHLGHRRIIEECRHWADVDSLPVVALTFDPPPDLVLRPDDEPQRIDPSDWRCRRLLAAGVNWVVVARTDPMLLAMAPDEFVEHVILRRLRPAHIVEGRNFYFGICRSGNISTLRDTGEEAGFVVDVVDPVTVDLPEGRTCISSTLVRGLVRQGRVAAARRCLGRDFTLYGRVVAGRGRGRLMEYPTANLQVGDQVVPGDAVYAGRAVCGDGVLPAAISIGEKPTLGPETRAIEAFLIGGRGDYYDQPVALEFVERLREQQRFEGIEQLKAQIAKDVARVREICE